MYIQLNGQIIYYEKTGEGSPVVLAHGNGETLQIFDALIPKLSQTHTVYALDSRGHGLSAAAEEYHYLDMAEDVASFIQALDLTRPAFFGFSDGGILGLLAASRRPFLFSALAVGGANMTPRGFRLFDRAKLKLHFTKRKDPLYRMMRKEPHITKKDLSGITIPTPVLAGEKDLIKRSETKRIAASIPNASLKILPGESHSSYVVHSQKLFPLLEDFFTKSC